MNYRTLALTLLLSATAAATTLAQTAGPANPLWHEQKVKNYLPHMTWPEVRDLLGRSDMVIIPVANPGTAAGAESLSTAEESTGARSPGRSRCRRRRFSSSTSRRRRA